MAVTRAGRLDHYHDALYCPEDKLQDCFKNILEKNGALYPKEWGGVATFGMSPTHISVLRRDLELLHKLESWKQKYPTPETRKLSETITGTQFACMLFPKGAEFLVTKHPETAHFTPIEELVFKNDREGVAKWLKEWNPPKFDEPMDENEELDASTPTQQDCTTDATATSSPSTQKPALSAKEKEREKRRRKLKSNPFSGLQTNHTGLRYAPLYAAAAGLTEILQLMDNEGKNTLRLVLAIGPLGLSLVHCASFNGQIEVLDWLNNLHKNEDTAPELMRLAGSLIATPDGVARSGPIFACLGQQLHALKWWIEHFPQNTLLGTDSNGCSPLHYCAVAGNKEMCCALLDASPVVEMRNQILQHKNHFQMNAIMHAAAGGSVEVVKYFVEQGCKLFEDRTHYESSLVHMAAANGHLPLLKYCYGVEGGKEKVENQAIRLADLDGDSPLLVAAYFGQLEVVQWLIEEAGVWVEQRSTNESTALIRAVQHNQLPVVKYLLEDAGANLAAKTKAQTGVRAATATDWAKQYALEGVASYLLKGGWVCYREFAELEMCKSWPEMDCLEACWGKATHHLFSIPFQNVVATLLWLQKYEKDETKKLPVEICFITITYLDVDSMVRGPVPKKYQLGCSAPKGVPTTHEA
eukprot:TRINITY_DN113065_c0_g1_i1.p1 TRINITY_DN113065_c0_g1~~TRINITY_DN113065_c0_g1_i1.p1  ORF type:complete len:639 (+),score=45.68 TRINITY_DN113065_c0_g1_i1:26-1942(+)